QDRPRMRTPSQRAETLAQNILARLGGEAVQRVDSLPDEAAFEVNPPALLEVCTTLRDAPELKFEMLMDLAGIDYLHYRRDEWQTISATRTGFSRGRVASTGPLPPV